MCIVDYMQYLRRCAIIDDFYNIPFFLPYAGEGEKKRAYTGFELAAEILV